MTLRHFLLLGFTAMTLTACGGSKPSPDLYVLREPDEAADVCTKSQSLAIDRPSAPSEYDSKRIAVMLDHNHLTYYTGAGWASPFPDQLQDFMSDAFAREGVNVLDDTNDHANTLHITIREADITNPDAPVVHLRLTGSVSTGGHVTRFKLNEQVTAEQNHMPQIVDAYDAAAGKAATDILKGMKLRCAGVYAGD